MGGDGDYRNNIFANKMFQSTPPHGGRLEQSLKGCVKDCFNPRPRMGGDTNSCFSKTTIITCFNPRPRMGGDAVRDLVRTYYKSFNPRPRMGGDSQKCSLTPSEEESFNPRPRMGGDYLKGALQS